jgi:hypothetical protein
MSKLVFAASLVAALAFTAAAAAGSSGSELVATVRPCALRMPVNANVPVRPGAYVIKVTDSSRSRYFSLTGRDLSRHTTGSYVGTVHWRVRLARGTYAYRCGPRLVGSIRVT